MNIADKSQIVLCIMTEATEAAVKQQLDQKTKARYSHPGKCSLKPQCHTQANAH